MLLGKTLLSPLDPEVEERFRAWRYCKLFHCPLSEYESRSYDESVWMLKIEDTYNRAVKENNER